MEVRILKVDLNGKNGSYKRELEEDVDDISRLLIFDLDIPGEFLERDAIIIHDENLFRRDSSEESRNRMRDPVRNIRNL